MSDESDFAAEDYFELIMDMVAQVPPGRVTTYGTLAARARVLTGKGSARQVGAAMAHADEGVPWWRVVNAKGGLAPGLEGRQLRLLMEDGTPMRSSVPPRVNLRMALWDAEGD